MLKTLAQRGAFRCLRNPAVSAGELNELLVSKRSVRRCFASGTADDADDDFKPKFKNTPSTSVEDAIKSDLNDNKVLLFMKGDPAAPLCGFSNMACQILNAYGVAYATRNVLADPELREAIKKFSSWPTIPQLYINGEFVGGSDILMGLHKSGDLKALLADSGDART